ncbi:unnamed protein product [Plutella xylostella]|uniref:(diamondback moth) hypothetical protein n=1 Tax=Plutella xylostella TaxID=51655 RepID=A0A8S4G102_PLUXY|nr:unnamed protein product [Plutella xylostella]
MWERQNVRSVRAGHGDPDNNIPRAAVQYYAPGHLSLEPNEHTFPKKATTYIAFSDDGNELLVNLGSEQVYMFDINAARRPILVESFIISHVHGNRGEGKASHGANGTNGTVEIPPPPLPNHARQLKEMANEFVSRGEFTSAVELYNEALGECPGCAVLYSNRAAALMRRGWFRLSTPISQHPVERGREPCEFTSAVELYNEALGECPGCAVLYSNRAAALMRRGWSGDTYAAIKDCYQAIRLDPAHVKSHFRLAKGLMDMRRAREAHECLLYFKDKFPRHANSHAVFLLQKDINVALENMDTQPDESKCTNYINKL